MLCTKLFGVFYMNWIRVSVLLLLFMAKPCVLGIQTWLKSMLMVWLMKQI